VTGGPVGDTPLTRQAGASDLTMTKSSTPLRTTQFHFAEEEGRDSHHGDLRKGAYLRRRADYRSQLLDTTAERQLTRSRRGGTG
jgi:hypothetical protein